jgi:hypothetical protein
MPGRRFPQGLKPALAAIQSLRLKPCPPQKKVDEARSKYELLLTFDHYSRRICPREPFLPVGCCFLLPRIACAFAACSAVADKFLGRRNWQVPAA